VQWPIMDSRSAIGLQYTHVYMKSANEAQVEAPELTLNRCRRFSLFMNGKRKRETDPIAFPIHFATGR
jgi:hypothetical protein